MEAQITIQRPEPKDDQAHIDAMVAKVDGKGTEGTSQETPKETPPASEDRPQWLPEKFKSPEDMAKAYAELEAKQSGKKDDTPPAEPPKDDTTPPADDDAAKALEAKGLDLNDFRKEFSEKGDLSAESYEKLQKAGYPKEIVDQYIAGQKALAVQYEADVKASAGVTDDEWDSMAGWAAENLSQEEKIAYNKAVDSGDIAQAKLAVAGLTAKYRQAYPNEGKLLGGKTSTSTGDIYESLAQMQEDMANPKYKSDPAFRKMVEQKIGRSKIL